MLVESQSLYLVVEHSLIMIINQEIKLSAFISDAVNKQPGDCSQRTEGIDLSYERQDGLIKNGLNILEEIS